MFKRLLKKEKGFTLVELLAVMVILGIVMAIAVPSVSGLIDKSKKDADGANKELFENAARLASVAHEGVEDLGDGDEGYSLDTLFKKGYLEKIPENPTTDSVYTGSVIVTETVNENDGTKTIEYKYKDPVDPNNL